MKTRILFSIIGSAYFATALLLSAQNTGPALRIERMDGTNVTLSWSNSSTLFLLQQGESPTLAALWTTVSPEAHLEGNQFIITLLASGSSRFFRLRERPLTTIAETSPAGGETDVAVTRETIFRFTDPLATNTLLGPTHLYAEFGGRRLLSRIELSSDRRTVTLFYLENLPGSARVRVTFNPIGLQDYLGRFVDVDGDGLPFGVKIVDFDTLSLTPLANTAVIGHVYASDPVPGTNTTNFVNRPLAGVRISVDGMEESLFTTTDAQGGFRLEPVPPGHFFVHIDGRTSPNSSWPHGSYYPAVGKEWEAVAGRTGTLAGGTGLIYLPFITAGTLQPVSMTSDTTITFPPSVIADSPALAGVSIMVPANSLFSDNGARGGMVGIAPVPPDRLPGPLPEGLEFSLVITVQTDGPSNFDKPVPACFPNLKGLAPGSKSALISFNHDTGQWEVVGPMTVTADGRFVCTDPGVGIRQPGWHGTDPRCDGGGGGGGPEDPDKPKPGEPDPDRCRKERSLALSAEAQCALNLVIQIPKELPVVGCVVSVAQGAVGLALDCLLDPGGCNGKRLAEQAIGSAIGCIPSVGSAFGSVYSCFYQAGMALVDYGLCQAGVPSPAASSNPQPADSRATIPHNICFEQAQLWADAAAVYAIIFGSEKWTRVVPSEERKLNALLLGIQDSLQPSSPGGSRIIQGERDAMLVLPLPSNISGSDAATLLERMDRLGAGELTSNELNYQTLADAASKLEQTALELQQRGWIGTYDAITRGLPQLSLEADQALDAQSAAAQVLVRENGLVIKAAQALGAGNVRAAPLYYKLTDLSSGLVRRGQLSSQGRFVGLILAPDTLYVIEYLEPAMFETALTVFQSASSGGTVRIPRAIFSDPAPLDSDGDGLPDAVEPIIGTNPNNADSDGDGIKDGAEVRQGTNPLDGLPVQSGIIATVKLPGTAVDVAAFNNLVMVAELDRGVSVVRALDGKNPTIIAQVDTPGSATRVAFFGNLVAVADGPAGLAIIDIADPPAARIVHQVALGDTLAVTTAGRVAYAGLASGQVIAVDMISGTVLDRLAVSSAVQDLALGGDFLYVLTREALHSVRLLDSPFSVVASVPSPFKAGPNQRLFVGGGIAYAVHGRGYNTFSLAIPGQPVLLAAGNTTQFGWKQVVANGSGYGLAAVGPIQALGEGPHNISLYDLRNPNLTDQFVTTFETPGIARAVSIYNGLAYVADSDAGVQVINYLPYDALGVPPAITLSSSFSAGVAEEGKTIRLTAQVTDDVQVRNVEFYVDGVKVATDGNFPFEYRFTTPLRSVQSNFTARAKATDTGGNSTWSELLTFSLVPDATAPRVTHTSPQDHSIVVFGSVAGISASFSEPINTNTLNTSTLRLFRTGTGEDVAVLGGAVSYREEINGAFLTFGAPLPTGLYRATVSHFITDLASNALAADFAWTFEVRNAVNWIRDTNGFWDVASNWSTGAVPQPGDNVIIDRPGGNFTITFRSGNIALTSLGCKEKLVIDGFNFGASVSVTEFSQIENNLTLTSGTLGGTGDINIGGLFTCAGGTLSGSGAVNANGGLAINESRSSLYSLTINGRTLNNAGSAVWSAVRIFCGNGSVINNLPGASFETTAVEFNSVDAFQGTGTFNNAGTFRKKGGTGTNTINGVFNNTGSVEVQTGTLRLAGQGMHTGSFAPSAGATLVFAVSGGAIHSLNTGSSVAGAGNVTFSGAGTVNINGSYIVSGTTTVGPSGVTVNFAAAASVANIGTTLTISGGTANFNSGEVLTPTTLNVSFGTLAGSDTVNVSGPMTWSGFSTLVGSGAINANGGLTINGNTLSISGRTLNNAGTAVWSAGSINTGNGSVINNLVGANLDTTFDGSFLGTGTFNNAGTFRKTGGPGTTTIIHLFNNTGSVQAQAGTLSLRGSGTHTGSFMSSAGATLALVAPSPDVQDFNAGSSVTGAGNVTFNGVGGYFPGEINVNGNYNVSGTTTVGPFDVILTLNGGYNVSGATLNILGGTANFNSGGTLTPVTLNVSGGTANFNSGSALTPVTLNVTGGTLAGSDTVTVSGMTTWNNRGALSGSGTVNANGGLTINRGVFGGEPVFINGRTLNNAGAGTWSARQIESGAGAVINNLAGASFDITSDNSFLGAGTFNNAGTFRKTGGTGTTTIDNTFTHRGSVQVQTGTLNFNGTYTQTAGETLLSGGNLSAAQPLQIQGGMLRGSGAITASVISSGQVNPGASSGILNVTGSYTQNTNGTLNIEIGGTTAGSQFDRLTVSSLATLDGTLNLSLINGFEPSLGDSFVILTHASRSGTFASISNLEIGNGKRFQATYSATDLTLQVVPSP